MDGARWFEDEGPAGDDEEPWEFSEADLSFLAALRARAAAWRVPRAPHHVGRSEDEASLLVRVGLADEEYHLVLGEWAVHFYGAYVLAGKVGDQLYNLHESPAYGSFRATGTAEDLAGRCADWFERLLSRPVVREEWPSEDGRHAVRWEFADTGEPLVSRYPLPCDGSPPAHRHRVRP
ncbi:hypothetical protein ACQYWQ_25195 [Streptomyces sp. P6-2-1]|uniref:hypothetical protein n=1 Tax=Streptomyces sp. P6-2-1 TaxID=3422591 RepID=UPI003D36CA0C